MMMMMMVVVVVDRTNASVDGEKNTATAMAMAMATSVRRQKRQLRISSVTNEGNSPTLSQATATASLPLPLPWGNINLLVLTDVHSWIAGHGRHESSLDADYGDILSFYQRLQSLLEDASRQRQRQQKQQQQQQQRDLFLVMNGDFMDGTGLSTIPPKSLTPLLTQMPFDIINLGNHELYHDETVEWLRQEFIPHWKGHYLTSNTLLAATGEPLGSRYAYLAAPYHSNSNSNSNNTTTTLLTFGFLYNFENHCPSTIVERVEDVVQQDWFTNVVSDTSEYQAILVMAHMHVTDPLIEVIRRAIRSIVGGGDDSSSISMIPIQFITGHTHIRGHAFLDEASTSFEAGRFLDTVGFCSFPTTTTLGHLDIGNHNNQAGLLVPVPVMDDTANYTTNTNSHTNSHSHSYRLASSSLFRHVFLDTNRATLTNVLVATIQAEEEQYDDNDDGTGPTSMATADGLALSENIHATQNQLGLTEIVGCAPYTFALNQSMMNTATATTMSDEASIYPSSSPVSLSLWGLYMYEIIPNLLGLNTMENTKTPISNPSTAPAPLQRLMVQGTGAFRYDLFAGTVFLDDVIAVCPFNDTLYLLDINTTSTSSSGGGGGGGLEGWQVLQVLNISIPDSMPPMDNATTASTNNSTTKTISMNLPLPPPPDGDHAHKFLDLPFWAVSTRELDYEGGIQYELITSYFHVHDLVQRVERVVGHPIPDPHPLRRQQIPKKGEETSRKASSAYHHRHHAATAAADDEGRDDFWTTTLLWERYIAQEWQCSNNIKSTATGIHTRTSQPTSLMGRSSLPIYSSTAGLASQSMIGGQYDDGVDGNLGRATSSSGRTRTDSTPAVEVVMREEKPWTVFFFIVSIVCGLYWYQKRKERLARSGYFPIGDATTTLLRTSISQSGFLAA